MQSQVHAVLGNAQEELPVNGVGTDLPSAAEAPALWAAMRPAPAHLHSPFGLPAIQMLPAGIAHAAQRLMNGGPATINPALVSTAPEQAALPPPASAPSQAEDELAGIDVPISAAEQPASAPPAARQVELLTASGEGATNATEQQQQQQHSGADHGPHEPCTEAAETTGTPEGGAAEGHAGVDIPVAVQSSQEAAPRKLLLQQQQTQLMGIKGSLSIPETPSLGQELRGGFKLPQHMDSLKVAE